MQACANLRLGKDCGLERLFLVGGEVVAWRGFGLGKDGWCGGPDVDVDVGSCGGRRLALKA